jgi:acetyl esterase
LLVTASLDPLRDQGRRYAAALAAQGVECHFMEMKGSIHGFVNLRKAVPSAQADLLSILAQAKLMLARILA